jgi:hypothetical protein
MNAQIIMAVWRKCTNKQFIMSGKNAHAFRHSLRKANEYYITSPYLHAPHFFLDVNNNLWLCFVLYWIPQRLLQLQAHCRINGLLYMTTVEQDQELVVNVQARFFWDRKGGKWKRELEYPEQLVDVCNTCASILLLPFFKTLLHQVLWDKIWLYV